MENENYEKSICFYKLICYILCPTETIKKAIFQRIRHGIYCEISSCKVIAYVFCERYRVRMTVICVFAVDSECCCLNGCSSRYNQHSAVFYSGINRSERRKRVDCAAVFGCPSRLYIGTL